MSATNRGAERAASDYYATPRWAIAALLAEMHPQRLRGRHVLDPCAGDGRIGRPFEALGAHVTYIDLEPRHPDVIAGDFLAWKPAMRFDLCAGNPPYKLAERFIRHARQHSTTVAMLCRLNLLGSSGRVSFWRANPPIKVIVLTPRPSFTEGGSDATEYGWLVWGSPRWLRDLRPFAWAVRAELEAQGIDEGGAAA